MKKHSFKLEITLFCVIFLTFILSPIISQFLTDYTNTFVNWSFPYDSLFFSIIAGFIYYYFKEKQNLKPYIYKLILPSTFCFCVLFCFSLIIKFFSLIISIDSNSAVTNVQLPDTLVSWIFCILRFIFAAFFEETIYRYYLPEYLHSLLKENSKKSYPILIEIVCMLLFAAAHIYMGIFSVINAIFAHAVLRFTFKKTNSIFPGFIAHFLYNIISLILL